jgi:predicted transglutaminase-like cysteine proteinase
MALDFPSGFCENFTRNARGAFGAALFVSAYSAPALGQADLPQTVMAGSAYADCPDLFQAQPNRLTSFRYATPQPAAGAAQSSKSAAILGGARSKLEEMRDSQAGSSQLGRNDMPFSAAEFAATKQPQIDECSVLSANPGIKALESTFSVSENAILGTLSVAIKHSPFDRDWAAVSAKQGSRKMQRVLAATGARHSGDRAAQVEAINRWVNRSIKFGEDRDVYGRADYWAPAGETLRRGIGDCEDFAIAKMELLSALGISRDKMRLVVARDLVRNADHAVLVVTLADGPVMLDNMTDQLLDARLPNDYRPIMSFSQNAKWVHGYAVQPAQPVRMASVTPLPQPAANDVREVLTVTVEPELPVVAVALLIAPSALPTLL